MNESLNINTLPPIQNQWQKVFTAISGIGVLILFLALINTSSVISWKYLLTSLVLISVGVIGFSYIGFRYKPEGIKNNGIFFSSLTNRGYFAWLVGIIITAFYILLYFFPSLLGLNEDAANTGLIAFFDPLSQLLKNQPASQWFVYGTLYTIAILIFGLRFIWKYRHNKYQILRTISVMFFQLGFAFLLPEILQKLNYPYNDFKNMWPLNYYFFDEWNIKAFIQEGSIGLFMLVFGLVMIFIISPILTYFYGKRWYCSWVCGCGGLAETAGDPFRHLSDKSLKAWQIERWMIHVVLVFVTFMTISVLYTFFQNNPSNYWISKSAFVFLTLTIIIGLLLILNFKKSIRINLDQTALKIATISGSAISILLIVAYITGSSNPFFIQSYTLRSTYGFLIGAVFSGVIGVGFYPIMGSRVWCRFGCPMAAILGIQQKLFSRFRITTNGGQCISCGNCSTYCEMGIDVRHYAQRGQNIVRASCVGCGICAAVCPRGVLRLENGSLDVYEKTEDLKTIHLKDLNQIL